MTGMWKGYVGGIQDAPDETDTRMPRAQLEAVAQSMVEQLAGDSNLIAVRSRATLNRPFTVVKKMEERAQESSRSKIKELEAGLSETQQKLNELQRTKEKGQRFILSPEQQQELAKFRQKEAEAKKELKQVRKKLRRDVDCVKLRLSLWIRSRLHSLIVGPPEQVGSSRHSSPTQLPAPRLRPRP